MKRTKLCDRLLPDYTHGEETMNFVTHVVGSGIAIGALVVGILRAALLGDAWDVAGIEEAGLLLLLLLF